MSRGLGDVYKRQVSVRENNKGEKVFEIDDSAGKRREAFNLQMEQMMKAPGMEPD